MQTRQARVVCRHSVPRRGGTRRRLPLETHALDQLACLLPENWRPPSVAIRDGGLWILSDSTIRTLPAGGQHGPFGELYETTKHPRQSSTSTAPTVWGCIGAVPRVECHRPPGSALPPRALQLVRSGMCCVLENAKLWAAAEIAWSNAEYLRNGLRGPCNVLSAPVDQGKRFSYWFDHSDRVQAGYRAAPLVSTVQMTMSEYLDVCRTGSGMPQQHCLYLQQTILQRKANGGMAPCGGLTGQFANDVEFGIDLPAVLALCEAGAFGPWQRCQLFVGSATVGARSILHFDQYDNLFLQIAGEKRFRIFDPDQTGCLYPYPIHHPFDTRSQVDLDDPASLDRFPRLSEARGSEVILRPGQTLFLPAYWWHEVTSLEPSDSGLNVSVNFWFDVTNRLLHPTRPLIPSMRCELARQLEYLASDCLDDQARYVPTFFRGLLATLETMQKFGSGIAAPCTTSDTTIEAALTTLDSHCPPTIVSTQWRGLFGFVMKKLSLYLEPANVLAFVHDLCHPSRFEMLPLR
ncbi:hypothetical protein AB1Y20_023153 [Prymnesium parvum]|uniref:JmjC domain-containing protein n=1 Tax=Prymnesium parvum TaxID=97485 RepID=A0AB34JEL8_PRYPA